VKSLPPETRARYLGDLSDVERAVLAYTWAFWARPSQQAPSGPWSYWVVQAGRGFGKTRTGAEWVRQKVERRQAKRIALVSDTAADVRDVMIEGPVGLLNVSPPWDRPVYEPSKRRVTWKNGAVAIAYAAESPELLRGPQHDSAWCFIAGTQVETEDGARSIESIRVGDRVWTRRGLRRVVATGDRSAPLARVRLSNGEALIGTEDHPVWTQQGWQALGMLKSGQTLQGFRASGSGTHKDISVPIRPLQKAGRNSIAIAKSGNRRTARFRAGTGSTSTTSTAFAEMTGWTISRSSLPETIERLIPSRVSRNSVSYAGEWSTGASISASPQYADLVNTVRPKRRGARTRGRAATVRQSFAREPVITVASDASTLGLVGRVYNLTVEGTPEFYANGVLVHNCDEFAKWKNLRKVDQEGGTAWDNLLMGLRIGDQPQCCVTTTPRAIPQLRELLKKPGTIATSGSSYDNRDNLSASWFQDVIGAYEGTRLGRQEIHAELLEDVEGALWKRGWLDSARVQHAPALKRIVVAIDPAVTSTAASDETGIVVAGLGHDGRGYVLDDVSGRYSPDGWAKKAVDAYRAHAADRIVAERNNGGDMVRHTLETVDRRVPITLVHASRGKQTRAEPVAALYEQGKVHHVGQMCTWEPLKDGQSPDRVDALVWALTELMVGAPREITVADVFG
jgi:predicted phage terminase large subunit-like protein